MLRHFRLPLMLVGLMIAPWSLAGGSAQSKGSNYAFLVGCSKYQKAEFHQLPYTGQDVLGFAAALKATGFEAGNIAALYDEAAEPGRWLPNKAHILHELDLLLTGMNKNDTIVVAISGHGLQFKGDPVSYFVPLDGKVADKSTLIPLDGKGGIYELIDKCGAGKKLLIVNACRNDPVAALTFSSNKTELVDEDRTDEVPKGIAAIYSCQAGQMSYFDKERKMAIFFDHVIKAWKGEYTSDGPVTLEKFFQAVQAKTKDDARSNFSRPQVPVVKRKYEGNWVIAEAPVRSAFSAAKSLPKEKSLPELPRKTEPAKKTELAKTSLLLPTWSHALDLRCRKAFERSFTTATRGFGTQVVRDENNHCGVYLGETGVIGVVPEFRDFKGEGAQSRMPAFLHGSDVIVRPTGVNDYAKGFTLGTEAFRDENTGDFIYITQTGAIAVAPGARSLKAPTPAFREFRKIDGYELKVLRAGETTITNNTKIWSIEIYVDVNTGVMLYITESGHMAIVPGYTDVHVPYTNLKAPQTLQAFDLNVHRGGQQGVEGQVKTFGLQLFRDMNNGNLIYMSETGSIAVVPAIRDQNPPNAEMARQSQQVWDHALDVKSRRFGEKQAGGAILYGVDVYNNTYPGCTIYISETGAIAAIAK